MCRTRDFEVGQVDELRKGSDEGWDVGCGVEERRVLLDEKIGHFRSAILWCFFPAVGALRGLQLRFVDELFLCASLWVDDGRK